MGWEVRKLESKWKWYKIQKKKKRRREGWLQQTESESTYSHSSPCLLFCVTTRQELIGQLSASAPSAPRHWERLHCRASSNTAGNLSFCQRKTFFFFLIYPPPPFFFLLLCQHFSKQMHKPAIWYIEGGKYWFFNLSNPLPCSFCKN